MTESLHGSPEHASDVEKNKDLAAFGYVFVMAFVVYFMRRDSGFVRFHSKQAMILCALSILLWHLPLIGWMLEFVVLAGMVSGFVSAAQGEWKDVPIVGPLSRREITLRDAWREVVTFVARIAHSFNEGRARARARKNSSHNGQH